jgi:serine/threonine protein kinase
MNPTYKRIALPPNERTPWRRVFRSLPHVSEDACDMLSKFLQYDPSARVTALQAMTHPFFDELREPSTVLPNGDPLPALFDFTVKELSNAPHLAPKLIPAHARDSNNWPTGAYDSYAASASIASPKTLPPIPSAAPSHVSVSRPGTSARYVTAGGSGAV